MYLMLLVPVADLCIFIWSKISLLALHSPIADVWDLGHLLPLSILLQPASLLSYPESILNSTPPLLTPSQLEHHHTTTTMAHTEASFDLRHH